VGKELVRVHVHIDGRVQGVAYRFFAEKYANKLGVTGWVRNLMGGGVEVVAEGAADVLETFLEKLRQGPSLARIDAFDVRRERPTGEFTDFRIAFFPE
jgi:acylphosphatase